jgi:uncharacterized membrane protein
MASFEERLAAETRTWVDEGLVSGDQAAAIIGRYEGGGSVVRRDRLVQALAMVGAVGVGLGVILFFAANWDGIPRLARLALLVSAIVGCYAAGDRLGARRPRVGHALLLLGCLLFGASLFLVGQMFNVAGHDPLAFLLWSAAAAAGAVLLRSEPFAGLAALTFGAWIVAELDDANMDEYTVVALALYAAALYAAGTRFRVGVLRVLGAGAGFTILLGLTFDGIGEEIRSTAATTSGVLLIAALVLAAVVAAAALALDRRRATARWEAAAVLGFAALFLAALFVDPGPLVTNLVLVALALGALAVGYAAGEPWLVNLALVAIVLEAAARFFDFFAEIMPRSLAFLVGGALVLGLAWALERQRSRLLQRAG